MRSAILCRSVSGSRRVRRGFTLVELLVAITIFTILATITLSAFRGSDKDKITAGARQIQAVFNGAKSRAAKSGEPRGVRLMLDPDDRRCANALQYIGSSSYHSGTVRVQLAASNQAGPVCRVVCNQSGEWSDLRTQGLLGTSARIRIPADTTGRWYVLNAIDVNDPPAVVGVRSGLGYGFGELNQIPSGSNWDAVAGRFQFSPAGPQVANSGQPASEQNAPAGYSNTQAVTYMLRLEPQPLPNTTPMNLPPGVVIDLDGSRVPAAWRQPEDVDRDGVTDMGEDLDGNGQLNFSYGYATGASGGVTSLDIMFGPDGTATGEYAALGPLFLTLAHVSDVELARSLRVVNTISTLYPAIVPADYQEAYGNELEFPNKARRAVSIYPQTGHVFISLVNGASAFSSGDPRYQLADDPFSFVYEGRDSK